MERKKIGREDFEALIKGEKDIAPYIELDPVAGTYSVFGVKTASNPNYLVKAIYEMYETNLNRKLSVTSGTKSLPIRWYGFCRAQ